MATNKIIYNNQTLIDLTNDTVTSDFLLKNKTAHNRAGEQITGTLEYGRTEELLWQNSNTIAVFNTQTITLSKSYTNFNSLKFYYVGRYNETPQEEYSVEYLVSDINKWFYKGQTTGGTATRICGSFDIIYNSATYSRQIRRESDTSTTQFLITVAYRLNNSGSGTGIIIPSKITGLIL